MQVDGRQGAASQRRMDPVEEAAMSHSASRHSSSSMIDEANISDCSTAQWLFDIGAVDELAARLPKQFLLKGLRGGDQNDLEWGQDLEEVRGALAGLEDRLAKVIHRGLLDLQRGKGDTSFISLHVDNIDGDSAKRLIEGDLDDGVAWTEEVLQEQAQGEGQHHGGENSQAKEQAGSPGSSGRASAGEPQVNKPPTKSFLHVMERSKLERSKLDRKSLSRRSSCQASGGSSKVVKYVDLHVVGEVGEQQTCKAW